MSGFNPFDLGRFFERMIPVYSPLQGTDMDRRHAAQQLAAERRKSAERYKVVHADWQNAGITASDERVKAVVELHEPYDLGTRITCAECMSYDSEGYNSPNWPCDTYKAVTG